jgi:hypothetical protein
MLRSLGTGLGLTVRFHAGTQSASRHTFREKLNYLQEMKPYILPFLHDNKVITRALLRSYGMLALSKLCFFGGPFFVKMGINTLTGAAAGNPLLMFLGFGLCYSGSVLFEQMRNLETLKIINIALLETTSKTYKHMLSLGPEFYFSGSQRHIIFSLFKAQASFEQNLKNFTQYFFPIFLDVTGSMLLLLHYSSPLFACSFIGCYALYAVFTIKYSDYRRRFIRDFR